MFDINVHSLNIFSINRQIFNRSINQEGDKETATDTTVADKVNEIFDNVKKSGEGKGDQDFLQILTTQFCLEIGMSPKSMSPQEIETLQSIFIRSKKYKQVLNQTKNKKMKKKR